MAGLSSFNPRAREGRDVSAGPTVFIHGEFQSTRPRGARPAMSGKVTLKPWFQSTRPRGARLESCRSAFRSAYVSIHAPARGATSNPGRLQVIQEVSIHAPARGATSPV